MNKVQNILELEKKEIYARKSNGLGVLGLIGSSYGYEI